MSKKNINQQKQESWYVTRAFLKLREARYYSRLGKCAEAVNSSYESLEFSVKALCKMLDVNFSRKHFVDEFTVAILAEKIGRTWPRKRERLLSVLPIIMSYSDRLREISRYGIERKDVGPISPDQIFGKDYCNKVLEDSKIMVDILSQIEKSQKWAVSKPLKMGILNGFSIDPSKEKQCQPQSTFKNVDFWKNHFDSLKREETHKYNTKNIQSSAISEEYALILNPYGEAYPESNVISKDTYEQIKIYIENGGVFANTSGFAFFYSWDHFEGKAIPISEEKYLLIHQQAETVQVIPELISFQGTLLYRDFGVSVTSDIGAHTGPHEIQPFQTDEDVKRFGKLTTPKLKEFRAVRADKTTADCLPILRAKCEWFGEIYLLAAIKFGRGYLIVGGFATETETEAQCFARAIDAFCDWASKKYSPK